MRALVVTAWLARVASADVMDPSITKAVTPELQKLGEHLKPRTVPSSITAGCKPLTASEKKTFAIDAHAFIDGRFPEEEAFGDWILSVGCRQPDGIVYADVSDDRWQKADHSRRTRRNFILGLGRNHQPTVVAESTSTPATDAMEWADEGRLILVAQLDVDRDGHIDLVYDRMAHEGGGSNTFDGIVVRLASGKEVGITNVTNLEISTVVDGTLVLGGQRREDSTETFACVMPDFTLQRCPKAATVAKVVAHNEAIERIRSGWIEERDQLAADLKEVGIDRADLLAPLPETTAVQRVKHHVDAFIESKQLDDKFQGVFPQVDPAAAKYLDDLALQFGDTRCVTRPLTHDKHEQLVAWANQQGAIPFSLVVDAECADYAWVQFSKKGDPEIYEFLMSTSGSQPVKVQKFKVEGDVTDGNGGPPSHSYVGGFFMHGTTAVGWVLRGQNLFVIANGKVVATSHGQFGLYTYDRRGVQSFDLFVEGEHVIEHPSPTGIDKVDRDAMRTHDQWRAAVDLVSDTPPSHDEAYLAALKLLGADAKLIAEAKKL
ncbi:MAG: hypothetical protein QM831_26790 [Kofleriaceae bacterium]